MSLDRAAAVMLKSQKLVCVPLELSAQNDVRMQCGFVDGDGCLVVRRLALFHIPDVDENISKGGFHAVPEKNVKALRPSASGPLHPVGGVANIE